MWLECEEMAYRKTLKNLPLRKHLVCSGGCVSEEWFRGVPSYCGGSDTYLGGLLHWQVDSLPLPRKPTQRRQWHPTPVLLPGKSYGWRSLVGCSSWGRWESDTTEWLHFYFSLSCIGEGNGNPLQCSCLEYPRDGGAWWAAVSGVTQSRTRLTWLSSSSIWDCCFPRSEAVKFGNLV